MGDDLSTVPKMPPLTSRLLAMVLALSALYVLTAMPVSDDVNHALSALESVPEEPLGSVANLQAELQADEDFGKLKRRRRRRSRKKALKRALDAQLRSWDKHLDRNKWKSMPLEKLNCPLLIKHRRIFGEKATYCTDAKAVKSCSAVVEKDLACISLSYTKCNKYGNRRGVGLRNGCEWFGNKHKCHNRVFHKQKCFDYYGRRNKRYHKKHVGVVTEVSYHLKDKFKRFKPK